MIMECFSYRKLRVYNHAKELVVYVYQLLKLFPKEENYALCDQLRRAVISIPSNIAEGMGRTSIKEQIHFIEIAFGSLYEVMCQIELAKDLNYITEVQFKEIEESVQNVAKPLSGLRSKRKKILNTDGIKG
jgi:four helix bundle protein